MMRFWFFLVAALLIGGCGGKGGSGGGGPQDQDLSALVDFGNQQTGAFSLEVEGTTVSGQLICNEPPEQPNMSPTRGLSDFLPAGSYNLTGTFTPPRSFTVAGTVPDPTREFTIAGELPTTDLPGSFTLTIGNETVTGEIPVLGQPKPTVHIDPDSRFLTPGGATTYEADVTGAPVGALLKYRWFIAAPSAYFSDQATPTPITGQDILTSRSGVKVQTSASDSGKLAVYCHVYKEVEGVRTFLCEDKAELELEDVQAIIPTWVSEFTPYPPDPSQIVEAYFWEFPVIPGAKDYVITIKTAAGATTQVYRMLQGSIENTAVTTIPYINGNYPVPPTIPVTEELSGVVRMNFIRRGNTVRMLVVFGNGFDPNVYRNATPTSVVVRF